MLTNVFRGLFDTDLTVVISVQDFLLCMVFSLAIGLGMAFAYMYRTRYTKSFVVTLALLPAVVCVVIMLVNGRNLHTVSGNGRRPDCRYGVSWVCRFVYSRYVRNVHTVQPAGFWRKEEFG